MWTARADGRKWAVTPWESAMVGYNSRKKWHFPSKDTLPAHAVNRFSWHRGYSDYAFVNDLSAATPCDATP